MKFVLDASLTLAVFFPDERTEFTEAVAAALPIIGAAVPALWFHEIANALHVGCARGRLTPSECDEIVEYLLTLPIVPVEQRGKDILSDVRQIADLYALSASDASYLHLALVLDLPLGTLDGSRKKSGLKRAAESAGVSVVTRHQLREWIA